MRDRLRTNTHAPGTSPPIAIPCRIRMIRSSSGAAMPIAA